MDRSFDLVALLKQHPVPKTHKIRPTQFVSVAGGVQKRLKTNIKYRKSSRLSVFDRIRNISKRKSPHPPSLTQAPQKTLHRKQQLEKCKEKKEKKKKEAAALKKKPFVARAANRATFGPPPQPKPMPSASGRIPRSQALRQRNKQNSQSQSFAPRNASFKPPQIKNLTTLVPTIAPVAIKQANIPKLCITFEPVLPLSNQTNQIPKLCITFEPVLPLSNQTNQKLESSRSTHSKTIPIKPNVTETPTYPLLPPTTSMFSSSSSTSSSPISSISSCSSSTSSSPISSISSCSSSTSSSPISSISSCSSSTDTD